MAATQKQFNESALDYLSGHAKNFKASMTGGDVTPVQPWFGEGGRLQDLNGTGAPPSPSQQQPSGAEQPAVIALTGTPKIPAANAAQPLPQPQPLPQQATGQQPSAPGKPTTIPVGKYGWKGTSESVNGNPTLVFGTPGTDNSGVGSWRPGSAQPASNEAVTALSSSIMRQPQAPAGQLVPAQQAVQPEKTPLEISMENSDRMKTPANQGAHAGPRYLSSAEGDALGIGWKGRLAKYREDVDTYNKATGNAAAMDLEAMREAGAGQRALLHAKGQNDANAIAMQRLIGDNAVNEARIGTEALAQQKGRMEIGAQQKLDVLNNKLMAASDPKEQRAIHRQILALHGKPDNQKFQIVTREETDPNNPMNTLKTPYVVDPDNPGEAYPLGGGSRKEVADGPAMQIINQNPAYLKAFQGATPEKQKEMIAAVKGRMKQIPAQ